MTITTVTILDSQGAEIEIAVEGTGTDLDPYIPVVRVGEESAFLTVFQQFDAAQIPQHFGTVGSGSNVDPLQPLFTLEM